MSPKSKKILRRSLLGFFILLIGFVFSVPFLFKGKLLTWLKKEIDQSMAAKVDFSDVDLSLIRHFPSLSIRIYKPDITGVDQFEDIHLLTSDYIDVNLNFWSVIAGGGNYTIEGIHLEKPDLHVIILRNGTANYSITKPSTSTAPAAEYHLSLKNYSLSHGHIIFDDRAHDMYAELFDAEHSGSGDFTSSQYDLTTSTKTPSLSFTYGGVPYINKAKTELNAKFGIDNLLNKYSFKDNDLVLNDLHLHGDGWIQLRGDDMPMDMKFSTPQNTFKSFLSLIPSAYTKDFANVKADGKFNLNASLQGNYNSKIKSFPAFRIQSDISNGSFQYPSMPLGMSDIQASLDINSPSSDFDKMKIDLSKFHFVLASNPFDAVLHVQTPVSDPNVDCKIKGIVNLANLSKAIPMESLDNLSGILNADVQINSLLSSITNKKYDKVLMSGKLDLKNMDSKFKGKPETKINDLSLVFNPTKVTIENMDINYGKSDFKGNGSIDNIIAYFSPSKTMTGNISLQSHLIEMNELMAPSTTATPNAVQDTTHVFDRFDFLVDAKADKILYDKYSMTNNAIAGHFTPNKMDIKNLTTQVGNTDIKADGNLQNIFGYLFGNEILSGNIHLNSNQIDLNQFMTSDKAATTSTAVASIIPVPKNINVHIGTNIKKLLYTNMDLENLQGEAIVDKQAIQIKNCSTNTLGGQIIFNGTYDTQNPTKPSFSFKNEMRQLDFQQSFKTLNSFQKIAPIAQFIDGKFNTQIAMEGLLGPNMMPDMKALNALGLLQTIKGAFKNFKPLQEVGEKLNIDYLKNMDLVDTKNTFEVKNGMVNIPEFEKKVKDIVLKISGSHSILGKEMEYTIKTKVPRKLLEKNAVGSAANSGLNLLTSEASKYGIDIKTGEFINVLFTITGSVTSPVVKMKLLSSDGQSAGDAAKDQLNNMKDKAVDSVKTRAQEELDKAKQKAKSTVDKAVDTATKVVTKKVDEATQKAIDEAKKKAGEVLDKQAGNVLGDSLKKKVDDKLGKDAAKKAQEEADKLKKKLDEFNPFGKKKKN